MNIVQKYKGVLSELSSDVQLVCVSKNHSEEDILQLYGCGQKIFGENKVQELVSKYNHLPNDIKWHLIGHLQSNKVKYIAPFITLIQSVDSLKLLSEINREAIIHDRVIDCLLQFHIAEEKSKFGLSYDEASAILNHTSYLEMKNVCIKGVMGIATYTDNEVQLTEEFRTLHLLFNKLKNEFFLHSAEFKEISMGMSDDYKIAIKEGSTMVRLGSCIFGQRNYSL